MLILILFLVASSALVYVSKDNMVLVSMNIGKYILADIPLYYVIVGSFILGLMLSFVMHFFGDVTTFWVLRSKRSEIKKNVGEVLELTKRIHQLELENERLKHTSGRVQNDSEAI